MAGFLVWREKEKKSPVPKEIKPAVIYGSVSHPAPLSALEAPDA